MPTCAQGWEVASQELGTTRHRSTGRPRPRRRRGVPHRGASLGQGLHSLRSKGVLHSSFSRRVASAELSACCLCDSHSGREHRDLTGVIDQTDEVEICPPHMSPTKRRRASVPFVGGGLQVHGGPRLAARVLAQVPHPPPRRARAVGTRGVRPCPCAAALPDELMFRSDPWFPIPSRDPMNRPVGRLQPPQGQRVRAGPQPAAAQRRPPAQGGPG